MSTDMDAARRRVVDREANAVRDAAGMDALPPALEEALERAIRTVAEANALTEEFDVGVRFKPTLVDAQRAAASHSRPSRRRRRRPRVGGGHRRHVGRHWAQE